jgi:FAD/FMN-containing dehydrogenase
VTRDDATRLMWDTRGRLVLPGDADYESLRAVAYSNFQHLRPAAIGVCKTLHDVRCFVKLIQDRRRENPAFRWVPRSGGHSTAGYCTVEGGLMLDLRGLDNIFVNPGRWLAHVGPGIQLRDFYRGLEPYGLFTPAGLCPDLRVGGFMQGGGIGFGSRWFGMNCDNVTEVEVVLADGRHVLANAKRNPDLFWAVRGGTGNNFGIVTRVTYRLHPLREVGAVSMRWKMETDEEAARGAHALDIMQRRYMGSNDDRRLGYQAFIQYGAGWSGPYLMVRAMYREERGLWRELLGELIATPGCQIEWEDMGPYYRMNNKLMGYEDATGFSPYPEALLASPPQEKQTRFFDKQLGVQGWRLFVDHMRGAKGHLRITPQLVFEIGGGAINDTRRGENAYIHRNVDFNAYMNTYWDDESEKAKAFAFMDRWLELGLPWTNGEAYQNYPKPYVTDWSKRYWAEYYPVLCRVKQKYDPTNLFRFEQSIGSDGGCSDDALALAESLVPELARSLRQPIEYPDPLGDQVAES